MIVCLYLYATCQYIKYMSTRLPQEEGSMDSMFVILSDVQLDNPHVSSLSLVLYLHLYQC